MISSKAFKCTIFLLVCTATTTFAKECFHGYCHEKLQTELTGSCHNINHVPKINLTDAQGGFFVHNSPHISDTSVCDNACATMHLIPTEDPNTMRLEMCCNKAGKSHCGANIGSGVVVIDPEKPSILKYTINGETRTIYVLDTDSTESFSIGYACVSDTHPLKPEHIYIVTRGPKLNAELESHMFNVLKENGIDATELFAGIKKEECRYNGYTV